MQDEMKDLVTARTQQLAIVTTFLQSARAGALESADARLAQIVQLATSAQADVRVAQDTERMDLTPHP